MRLVAVAHLHGHLPADLPYGDLLALVGDTLPVSNHEIANPGAAIAVTIMTPTATGMARRKSSPEAIRRIPVSRISCARTART